MPLRPPATRGIKIDIRAHEIAPRYSMPARAAGSHPHPPVTGIHWPPVCPRKLAAHLLAHCPSKWAPFVLVGEGGK